MSEPIKLSWTRLIVDKKAILAAVEEVNAELGFIRDPNATPQKVREMMRKLGITAEDNIFSCGIISARD